MTFKLGICPTCKTKLSENETATSESMTEREQYVYDLEKENNRLKEIERQSDLVCLKMTQLKMAQDKGDKNIFIVGESEYNRLKEIERLARRVIELWGEWRGIEFNQAVLALDEALRGDEALEQGDAM